MTELNDFDSCTELISNLDGNGKKVPVIYNGEHYIMKFGEDVEPDEKKPLQGSYIHSPISEHAGCMVSRALGLPTQETLLGTYKGREVVLCKNFLIEKGPEYTLVQFKSIENTMISSSKRGKSPRLESIKRVIEDNPFFEGHQNEVWDRYWKQFVLDAIIGNFDRHSGNWGYIAVVNEKTRLPERYYSLAPVYDCASSMAPRLSEDAMSQIVDNPTELRKRALEFPKAKLIVGERKKQISYQDLFASEQGKQARKALFDLGDRIKALDIGRLVSSIPGISNIRSRFYEQTIGSRIETILQPAYDFACEEQRVPTEKLVMKTEQGQYIGSKLAMGKPVKVPGIDKPAKNTAPHVGEDASMMKSNRTNGPRAEHGIATQKRKP